MTPAADYLPAIKALMADMRSFNTGLEQADIPDQFAFLIAILSPMTNGWVNTLACIEAHIEAEASDR